MAFFPAVFALARRLHHPLIPPGTTVPERLIRTTTTTGTRGRMRVPGTMSEDWQAMEKRLEFYLIRPGFKSN
jgi:hypothetical protein